MPACVPRDFRPGERARALGTIEDLFAEVQSAFVRAGLLWLERVRVTLERPTPGHDRHFASCRADGLHVAVQPKLVLLPDDQQIGILAHELGHAADFLYPGRLRVRRGELLVGGASGAGERRWARRTADQIERDADAIASALLGVAIGYTGGCDLQTVGRGRPRPRGLR